MKGDGLLRHFQNGPHPIDRQKNFLSHFFRRRLPAVFLNELFCTRINLLIVSIMCTGMRMVRA